MKNLFCIMLLLFCAPCVGVKKADELSYADIKTALIHMSIIKKRDLLSHAYDNVQGGNHAEEIERYDTTKEQFESKKVIWNIYGIEQIIDLSWDEYLNQCNNYMATPDKSHCSTHLCSCGCGVCWRTVLGTRSTLLKYKVKEDDERLFTRLFSFNEIAIMYGDGWISTQKKLLRQRLEKLEKLERVDEAELGEKVSL